MVFTRTKHGAKALARQLNARGVPTVELHGNLAQNARTRNMAAFHSGRATTLVATDIAARGIHVDDVALVVHADPPAEHKAYLHRSGRTARAGAAGTVITLMTDQQVKRRPRADPRRGHQPDHHQGVAVPSTRCCASSLPATGCSSPAVSSRTGPPSRSTAAVAAVVVGPADAPGRRPWKEQCTGQRWRPVAGPVPLGWPGRTLRWARRTLWRPPGWQRVVLDGRRSQRCRLQQPPRTLTERVAARGVGGTLGPWRS